MSNVRQREGLLAQAEKMLENAKENRDRTKNTNTWKNTTKTYVSALG